MSSDIILSHGEKKINSDVRMGAHSGKACVKTYGELYIDPYTGILKALPLGELSP